MSMAEGTPAARPIIVLGVERSGTSVVAEMTHRWGAYVGEPEKLAKADEYNPQGYWEYQPLWDFLVELGDLADGISWWDTSFQERVREKAFVPYYREKALELVADMEKEDRPWIWKDPAINFYLPFWKEIWGNAIYLITVRNPYDTARSWQKFVLQSKSKEPVQFIAGNLLRWQYMTLLILEHTEPLQDKIFISYEGLVQGPRPQARRLYEFLNATCKTRMPEDVIEAMAQVVNPNLHRHHSPMPFVHIEEATTEQKALYQFVEDKIRNPREKFEAGKYPMYTGWKEFVKNEELLVRILKAMPCPDH